MTIVFTSNGSVNFPGWRANIQCIDPPAECQTIVSQLDSKSDWILDAEESVDYGFADGVLGSRKFPNIDTIKSALSKSKKKR